MFKVRHVYSADEQDTVKYHMMNTTVLSEKFEHIAPLIGADGMGMTLTCGE